MRFGRLIALVCFALAGCAAATPPALEQAAPPVLTQANQPFHRGVNVLGYDPYWTDTSKRRFEWRHFDEMTDEIDPHLYEVCHVEEARAA